MSEVTPDAPAVGAPDGVPTAGGHAALLVDYQSLHHFLKGRVEGTGSTADLAGLLFTALREHLAESGDRIVRGRAYADFGALDDHARHVQRLLYLHGIEPVFVPATTHRNTRPSTREASAASARRSSGVPRVPSSPRVKSTTPVRYQSSVRTPALAHV